MDTTNVQAAGPDPWAEIAAELRRVADDAEKLVGEPAPSCFQIHIQPKPHDVPAAVAAVDTIALALLGKAGETKRMSDGVYHRNADAERGPISMSVYRKVPEPPTAEIERLRARLAELEARDGLHASDGANQPLCGADPDVGTVVFNPEQATCRACVYAISRVDPLGLAYTRADDAADPTPTGPRQALHAGGVTEGGLVDETPAVPHPSWPAEAELKPWESLIPEADRVAESVKPIDPDSSMEAHYDAEAEAITGAAITEACVITGWAGLCTTHKARHTASGEAECGCPIYPYAGRGDSADTIVDHRTDCADRPF